MISALREVAERAGEAASALREVRRCIAEHPVELAIAPKEMVHVEVRVRREYRVPAALARLLDIPAFGVLTRASVSPDGELRLFVSSGGLGDEGVILLSLRGENSLAQVVAAALVADEEVWRALAEEAGRVAEEYRSLAELMRRAAAALRLSL